MIIAVPTGVKIYNWLFTMYGGRIRFTTPMLWSIGFMVTFVIGGMTGVLLAVPPADFVLHNSLFLVAHFHNVIIGGVLFGAFAGYDVLVPEGVRLPAARRAGARPRSGSGWSASMSPSCRSTWLGLLGMTRRMQHYDVAGVAALADRRGVGAASDRWSASSARSCSSSSASATARRCATSPAIPGTAARWNGRRLAAAGVQLRRPAQRRRARRPIGRSSSARSSSSAAPTEPDYQPIEMPRNSPTGFVCAFFATVMGFALIWHIWWLVILGLVGAFATFVVFAWRDQHEYEIPADEVARIDRANRRRARAALVPKPGAP